MRGFFTKSAAMLATGVSAIAMSQAATAQESDAFVLEEITVTAQKREQSLRDVPISVSTLSGDNFNGFAAGGEDIRLLSARIPGLNAESSNGRIAPRFYMRGLGNTDFDLAASQPISIVMDEVVRENVVLKSFPLFDVSRIEVLRGPQGTLFGRNTPAGIIKIDTRNPSQEIEGYVNASYGSFGTFTAEGAIGGGLSDTVAIRAAAIYQDRSDWIDNGFTGEENALGGFEEIAGRVKLLFTPKDNFEALAQVQVRRLRGTSAIFRANIVDQGSNSLNNNFDRDTVFFSDTHNNPQEADNWGTSLKMTYDFDNGLTLTSITAYENAESLSLGDIDGGNAGGPGFIPFQSTTQDGIDDLDQFTQEIRFSQQATDEVFWQAGFFYFDEDKSITTTPFFVPDTTVNHENKTWAIFGQVAYDLSADTTLTMGMRYTDDDKELSSTSGATGAVFNEEVSGSRLSWDIAINHIVNDDVSVYGRVASGFRAPTIQGRDIAFFGAPSIATEETIMSYELGFKATLAEGRARWNGAIFYWNMNDQQLSAVGGTGNLIQLVNADKSVAYGFETDIEYLVTENLTITAGLAYADTELKDDTLRVGVCGSGQCTPLDPLDDDGFALVDGNPLPQAPKWTANFTADYGIPMGEDGELFFFTDWAFQGKKNLFLYESTEFKVGTTLEGGLRVGYRKINGDYEIAGFVRNITNEADLKGAIDFNNNTGYVNEPRVWGVALTKRF